MKLPELLEILTGYDPGAEVLVRTEEETLEEYPGQIYMDREPRQPIRHNPEDPA